MGVNTEKPKARDIIVMFMAEFFGTAFYLFFGCMGCIDTGSMITHFHYSFAFGMVLVALITSFGHISQSHLNPAVTICAALYGTFPILLAPIYILAQVLGCILGFGILKAILPDSLYDDDFCVTTLRPEVSWFQGFLIEFFATLIWVFVCCGLWDHRNTTRMDSLPLKLGFAVFCLTLATVRFTGGSMNPVRSLGPAIFNNSWNSHWIYWIAPCLAGTLATFMYTIFYGGPVAINKAKNIAEYITDEDRPSIRKIGSAQFYNLSN